MPTEQDENEYFEYLDELHESGITNMFGAAPYLQDEYDLEKHEASNIVLKWMRTFSERHGIKKD